MSKTKIILIFFLLPTIAPLLFPPHTLAAGIAAVAVVAAIFVGLGFLLLRGSMQALKLSIFLQGLNAIIRTMMFFSNATFSDGTANIAYIVTSVLSIGISVYVLIHLDRTEVRIRMVR